MRLGRDYGKECYSDLSNTQVGYYLLTMLHYTIIDFLAILKHMQANIHPHVPNHTPHSTHMFSKAMIYNICSNPMESNKSHDFFRYVVENVSIPTIF